MQFVMEEIQDAVPQEVDAALLYKREQMLELLAGATLAAVEDNEGETEHSEIHMHSVLNSWLHSSFFQNQLLILRMFLCLWCETQCRV
jgi:hypothetical protein